VFDKGFEPSSSRTPGADRRGAATSSDGAADRVNRILLGAVVAAIALVLSVMAWVVYSVLVPVPAPRTETERQVMKLEELSKTQPKNAVVWADWAKALVAAEEYSKAADVIARGAKEASESAPILLVKAQMLSNQGLNDEALALVVEVIADLERLEAAEIKKMAGAGTTMTESSLYSPYVVDALILKGDVLARIGKTSDAVAAYSAALDRRPDMADVRVARGDEYAKLGRRAEAVADYRRALTMIPDFQPALAGLSKLGEAASQ
jgi:tetratricopeptide (TPR) repeat protein